MKKVAVIMGSDSDLPVVTPAIKQLKELNIETEVRVMSAHRTPKQAQAFAENAADNGFGVIIAAAGMAAHLGGVLLPASGCGRGVSRPGHADRARRHTCLERGGILCGGRNDGVFCPALPCDGSGRGGGGLCRRVAVIYLSALKKSSARFLRED